MYRHTVRILTVAMATLVLAACGSSSDSDDAAGASKTSAAAARDIINEPPDKSWRDALAAARDEFTGEVTKIELDRRDDGGLDYKIELISEVTEYVVQFDADTLEKLSEDRENLGDDAEEDQQKAFDSSNVIDLISAADTAREQQSGAIVEWKIEGEDSGGVQYQFDILPDGADDDVEVTVDAKTGEVVPDS